MVDVEWASVSVRMMMMISLSSPAYPVGIRNAATVSMSLRSVRVNVGPSLYL